MPTGCSSALRMDREVNSVELALMLPTNSGELKSTSLGFGTIVVIDRVNFDDVRR